MIIEKPLFAPLFRLYIDPSLKKKDKELSANLSKTYGEIESGFYALVNRSDREDNFRSIVFVGEDLVSDFCLKKSFNGSLCFFIEDESNNMFSKNLFDLKNDEGPHCIKFDQNSPFEEIRNLIDSFVELSYKNLFRQVEDRAWKNIEIITSKFEENHSIAESIINEEHDRLLSFYSFEEQVLSSGDVDQAMDNLVDFITEIVETSSVRLIKTWDQLIEEANLDFSLVFPLSSIEGASDFIAIDRTISSLSNSDLFFISWAMKIYQDYIDDNAGLNNQTITHDFIWERAFDCLDIPVALLSSSGELLQINSLFSKLDLLSKDCLNFKGGDNVTLGDISYNIVRADIYFDNQDLIFFALTSAPVSSQEIDINSSNELGIITSSVAHELNNPLAGILAALSVLGLDDSWSKEELSGIAEMKKGAKRCKDLVETFLGFSKMNPNGIGGSLEGGISLAIEQAFNLIRFRLIESNIRLAVDRVNLERCTNVNINPSIVSMIFYLVLGELLTAYSHHQLISNEINSTPSNKIIEGVIEGMDDGISVEITTVFHFEQNISNTKLIKHLLDLEGMSMIINGSNISFSKLAEVGN